MEEDEEPKGNGGAWGSFEVLNAEMVGVGRIKNHVLVDKEFETLQKRFSLKGRKRKKRNEGEETSISQSS